MPSSTAARVIVAIDGAAGSGKTTLARGIARELSLPYVNTGVMYRALARAALERGIAVSDAPALATLAGSIRFGLGRGSDGLVGVEVEGSPPGTELSASEVEAIVSEVASHPAVREVLVRRQRALGAAGGVIEGRDIGTVVFPDATLKVFLRAEAAARAERRARERRDPGADDDAARVARALEERDARDAITNPFEPAPDALVIDASELTIDEVRERALEALRARLRSDDAPEPP